MTTADAEGLIDAIRERPLDPVNRLVYADWLADEGDAEEEAWHRWVASKCGEMTAKLFVLWIVPVAIEGTYQPPRRLYGSHEALEAGSASGDFRPHAHYGPQFFTHSHDNFRGFLRVADEGGVYGYATPIDEYGGVKRDDARRILREAYPA